MVPQVQLFSFVFWENWRHQKDILKGEVCCFISPNQDLVIKSIVLGHKLLGIIVENYNRDFTKMKFDHPENP